ncbi:hypothetical protein BOX15_Mlig006725g1 [Macrostomum lignano]|uniref:Uncharacterized protein n=1 Tax=Macrostomum lignano TaxID=282301 RepID=A0A267GM57_9PLAT|nr:hypothetical protein BOX15_Mlig006725g1 [Macrostomum lignano]
MTAATLHTIDYVVLVANFIITLLVGIWSAWRSERSTTVGYFLASASMTWPLIGFSIFMTNIGSSAVIGLSGAAAASGIPVICYELFGVFGILIMGYLFMPLFYEAQVYTNAEYLQKRFGRSRLQIYISAQTLVFQVLHKIPSEIYAGGLIAEAILNWNRFIGIAIVLVMTAVVTIVGGLKTVLVTDFYQGIIMVVGGAILAGIAYSHYPSLELMKTAYSEAIVANKGALANTTCRDPSPWAFHIVRPISDPDYPWLGTLFGILIICVWYFCGNQDLLQRCFSGKNLY